MTRLAFVVLGEPVGKGRPRFVRKTGRTYTPEKTREYEALISDVAAFHAITQGWPRSFDGLCEVRLTFVCPRPENRYRKVDPVGRMWRESGRYDVDNYCKAVLDGMQTAGVFKSDSQVVRLRAELVWNAVDEGPCVEVEVLTVGERAEGEVAA